MAEQLYSAEEAARILGLQVRTVRNYIREGRLPGARIGKQYRISRRDLEAFAGGGNVQMLPGGAWPAPQPLPVAKPAAATIQISCIAQVDGLDAASADRITRTLSAYTAGRNPADPELRVEPLYDEERRRLKAVIVGAVADSVELIRLIDALARPAPPGSATPLRS